MYLDCGKKPDYPEEVYTNMGRTCKQGHKESPGLSYPDFKPGTSCYEAKVRHHATHHYQLSIINKHHKTQ